MPTPRWLTMKQAAELAGVSPRTMRRRLVALNIANDGRVLRSFGTGAVVRKWHVHPKVLARVLEPDETTELARLDVVELKTTVEHQRHLISAQARAIRELRQRVARLELPSAAE